MTQHNSRLPASAVVEILQQLAPNWSYAKHVLLFGNDRLPELTNFHNQVMTVTNFDPDSLEADVITDIETIKGSEKRFDVVLCANVLNLSDDLDATMAQLAKLDFDACVIHIDEGDGTGQAVSGEDGYHRNELVSDYVAKVHQHFHRFDVTLHRSRKAITVVKGRRFYHMDNIDELPLSEPVVAPEPTLAKKAPKKRAPKKPRNKQVKEG